jgi:hypothetical protein
MPAPPLANSFEGGSDGTTITTGNSGGASGNAFDNVTIGLASTVAFQNNPVAGGLTGHMTMGATAAATHIDWTGLGSITGAVYSRMYLYKTATPPATWFYPMQWNNNASARCAAVAITAGNILRMDNAAGSSILTSTITIPNNQWVRIETKVVPSTTVGTVEYRIYLSADASHYDETKNATGLVLGANIDQVFFGLITTPTNMNGQHWYYDNLAVSTVDWIGSANREPASPPVNPLLPRLHMFSMPGRPQLGFQLPRGDVVAGGPATIPQTLTADAVLATASMVRQTQKNVTATAVAATGTITKQVGKALTATSVAATASLAAVKVKLLAMTATAVVVTASIVKQVNKPLTATSVAVTAIMVKQVNKLVTATSVVVTATLVTIKVKLLAMTATAVVVTASMVRQVGKPLTATPVVVSASLIKQVRKTLTGASVVVTASLATIKVKLVAMTATAVVVTATMTRRVNTTLSATVVVTASMVRQIAKGLSATVVLTASLVTQAIIAGAVQVISYFRSSPSEPGYTDTPAGTSGSTPDEGEFGSGPSGSSSSNPTEGRFDS